MTYYILNSHQTHTQLLPICPIFLLTMHIIWSNVSNTSPTTAPLIIDHSKRMTWRDYLTENSVEQEIRGSEMERRRIMETIKKMEVFFKRYVTYYNILMYGFVDVSITPLTFYYLHRWVTSTKDTRLIQQCVNKHGLCAWWASSQECTSNPVYMEDNCILACQQCNKLTDDVF